jgi:hypothetical protein
MSRDEKTTVDITNRPSNKNKHSDLEWSKHLESRELYETRRDIRAARVALSGLSVRFVTEAICGDDTALAAMILSQIDGDELVGDMSVDPRDLRKLADTVGGPRAKHVVEHSTLKEVRTDKAPAQENVSEQQVELLRALLKTMDPNVIKRALSGD